MSVKRIQFSPMGKERREEDETEDEDSSRFVSSDLTVKFEISDSQTIIAHSYKRTQTLKDIRRDISEKFQVSNSYLDLFIKKNKNGDTDTAIVAGAEHSENYELLTDENEKLEQLARNQFGIVELKLKLNCRGEQDQRTKLDLAVYYRNVTLSEIITVNLGSDGRGGAGDDVETGGEERKVIVEIENRKIVKPFLGGFRNPENKIEYHNAYTQTGPLAKAGRRLSPGNSIVSRETQTDPQLMKSLRTTRTPRNEIREFVSSDEMVVRLDKLKRIKLIQRNFRAYKWRKFIRESAEQWRVIQQKAKERNNYDTANADYNRVLRLLFMEPTAKEEFDQIYIAIQHWKREETERLKERHSDGSYIAELNLVLEKEIFLLGEVEQRREVVRRANQEKSSERQLKRLGNPRKFISSSRSVLEIDTLCTQRVRFWIDFYDRLKSPPVDKLNRLALLDNVMECLKGVEYSKLTELQELIERERKLWERNFTSSDMDTLRERQLLLLVDLIQTLGQENAQEFSLWGDEKKRICGKCKVLLPENNFVLLGRKDIPDICKQCNALHRKNKHGNVYREILRSIRRDQKKCGALSSFAFIIQEHDIEFIVETIWHGHSILSQTTDRRRLRLPRWIPSQEWSPWNCICLTETEAKAHLKLRDFNSVYQDHLLKLILSRNNLAFTSFRRLQAINYEFVESGQWWNPLEEFNNNDSGE